MVTFAEEILKEKLHFLRSVCNCGYEVESIVHFFLHCILYANERSTLFSTLGNLDSKLFENTCSLLTDIFLFGKEFVSTNQNMVIFNAIKKYILSTKRFDESILIS